MRRRTLLAGSFLLAALALTGCGAFGIGGTSGTCVDWVLYDTPQDAAANADAVVIGRVPSLDATTRLYDLDVHVWNVEVESWVQGEGEADEISVVSAPRTCETGSPYPDGDPLETDDEVMLFLSYEGNSVRTITGYQGVIVAPADRTLPDAWPDGAIP